MKFPSRQKDFLRPFAPFFKGKQLIVFVTAQPTDRLDECDILVTVNCTDEVRLGQLRRRNADAEKRISATAGYRLVKPKATRNSRSRTMAKSLPCAPGKLAFLLVMCAAGCAVIEQDYPATWDPLLQPATADCARFAGSYADRGEAAGTSGEPSLSHGLFGHHSGWKAVRRVDFELPDDGVLEITAWDAEKPLFKRTLTSGAGDFQCRNGQLVVRSKRWVASDLVSGRESVTIELNRADGKLVAHVKETTYGTIFAVVPIAGTAAHWYRFARISP